MIYDPLAGRGRLGDSQLVYLQYPRAHESVLYDTPCFL
jgi:hypothetical protein